MTNSDVTSRPAPQATGRRRRFRPWAKGGLAAVLGLLGVGFFVSPAFGHTVTVSGSAACASTSYTITWTITNDFPEVETASVQSVTGGLGTLSATTVTIGNGSTTNLTTATVTQTLPATDSGLVSISVLGTWPNPNPYSMTASASTSLPTGCFPPKLSVTKSIISPAPPVTLPAGSSTPVVYGLTAKNTGALATAAAIDITDAIPADTTYVAGSATCVTGAPPTCSANESGGTATFTLGTGLAAGASYLVEFAVTVNASAPSGTIPNQASFTGPGCTPTAPATTCKTNTVYITVPPTVVVTKSANTSAVTAGQTTPVTYTLTAANTSPTLATTMPTVITDVVPSGLTYVAGSASCGTIAAGKCTPSYSASSNTVTFTLAAGLGAGDSEAVSFQGTVNGSDTTSILNNADYTGNCSPVAPATTCVTNTVTITVANFTVTKSDSAGSNEVNPGDVVTYTLLVDNIGTGPGSITVTDGAPTGTTLTTPAAACPAGTSATCAASVSGAEVSWVITGMPAGGSYALTFAVKVNPGTGGTHILNTGVYTEPGCTTAGGCKTNTTDNPVPPPVAAATPTTTTTVPTTIRTAATGAIAGASTVHTGEPWAGSTPYVLAVLAFGLSLLGVGTVVRRRRAARTPAA
ncbi:MAG: hypothetical protein ACRDY1_07385 [Acidimicrobiales bacterium]